MPKDDPVLDPAEQLIRRESARAEAAIQAEKPGKSLAIKRRSAKLTKLTREEMESIEDGLLMSSLKNLSGAVEFAKIDPAKPDEVPPEWRELPKRELDERMRVAKYAMLSSSEAPFGLKLSTHIVTAIMQLRAKRGPRGREFRASHASLPAPAPKAYPVIDESSDED